MRKAEELMEEEEEYIMVEAVMAKQKTLLR